MDINDLRALSTLLVFLVFIGICWMVFRRSRKAYYEQASMLPFQDDPSVIDGNNERIEGEK